jgi:hypothetical protein
MQQQYPDEIQPYSIFFSSRKKATLHVFFVLSMLSVLFFFLPPSDALLLCRRCRRRPDELTSWYAVRIFGELNHDLSSVTWGHVPRLNKVRFSMF